MYYLIGAIVCLILGVTIVAIVQKKRGGNPTEVAVNPDVECCGAHDVCEADSLLNANVNVIYYDDEELDRFQCREAKSYTDDEVEEFQEVLLTMKEVEVAAWLRSLTLRNVELPSFVKEEALMIVGELREIR
ncbi:MAG: phospholipase [Bacteroidales bacterium]|jgi:hypothetical protein|nr:phospholipase [Bacteroidales bacterium]